MGGWRTFPPPHPDDIAAAAAADDDDTEDGSAADKVFVAVDVVAVVVVVVVVVDVVVVDVVVVDVDVVVVVVVVVADVVVDGGCGAVDEADPGSADSVPAEAAGHDVRRAGQRAAAAAAAAVVGCLTDGSRLPSREMYCRRVLEAGSRTS